MPFALTMPKLSPTMEEGQIVKWHVRLGDHVKPGALLFEVSTDKATVEHNALDEGWVRKILVPEGKTAKVNDAVAIFTEKKDESIDGFVPPKIEVDVVEIQEEIAPMKMTKKEEPMIHHTPSRVVASPLAKKLAKERNVELSTISGTGPGGRILSRDLQQLVTMAKKKKTHTPGAYEEIPLSPIRKVIAKRLLEAKNSIPHFYVTVDIDAKEIIALREQLKRGDVKLTINDFVIKAVALSLQAHPEVNSGFDAKKEVIQHYIGIDVSVAVSIPEGLITPIIFDADQKSVQDISTEVHALAKRAKENKLKPEEFQGGSFTISNLGMYGVKDFNAIINPPQSAILAVGAIRNEPVVINEEVVPGKKMSLTLSCDHRVVDGVKGAEFLETVKQLLEHPALLLLS